MINEPRTEDNPTDSPGSPENQGGLAGAWEGLGIKGLSAKKMIPLLMALIFGLLFMWLAEAKNQVLPLPPKEQEVAAGLPQGEESPALQQISGDERALEAKVAAILSKIEGVGRVHVSLTFAQGVKTDYAVNTGTTIRSTQEQDSNGGTKQITEETQSGELVLESNSSKPVAVQEIMPEMKGVLVVAQGGDRPAVCAMITKAVESLLAVPAHKIVICPAGKE